MISVIFTGLLIAGTGAAAPIHVHAGRLLDPEAGVVLIDQMVTISAGRITAVAPWAGPPPSGTVIDWSGYTVLPGLIDVHTHVADGWGETADPAEALRHSEAVMQGGEIVRP